MGSLIGSQFRNALAMRLNGTNQYGWVDNPTFKTRHVRLLLLLVQVGCAVGANGGQDHSFGYGVNDGANDSVFLIGSRRTTATGTGTYMAINTRTTNGGTNNGVSGTTTPLGCGVWHGRIARNQRHHMGNAN
jgi:hypothetical protein